MACRGMDAESCPNDGTKMHNVNFTKNDVRNVRILRFLTFLTANIHYSFIKSLVVLIFSHPLSITDSK